MLRNKNPLITTVIRFCSLFLFRHIKEIKAFNYVVIVYIINYFTYLSASKCAFLTIYSLATVVTNVKNITTKYKYLVAEVVLM